MPYGPAEIGIPIAESRPFGESAADIAATRERRAAAQSVGAAEPSVPSDVGAPPVQSDVPPGGPPMDPQPDPNRRLRRLNADQAPDTPAPWEEHVRSATRQERDTPPTGREQAHSAAWETFIRLHQANAQIQQGTDVGRPIREYLGTVASHAGRGFADLFAGVAETAAAAGEDRGPMSEEEQLLGARNLTPAEQAAGAKAAGGLLSIPAAPFTAAADRIILPLVQQDPFMGPDYERRRSMVLLDDQNDPVVQSGLAHEALDSQVARLLRAGGDPRFSEGEQKAANVVAFGLIMLRAAEFGIPVKGAAAKLTPAVDRAGAAAARGAGAAAKLPAKGAAAIDAAAKQVAPVKSFHADEAGMARVDLGLFGNPEPLRNLTTEQLKVFIQVADPADRAAAEGELLRRQGPLRARMAEQGKRKADQRTEAGATQQQHGLEIARSAEERAADEAAVTMRKAPRAGRQKYLDKAADILAEANPPEIQVAVDRVMSSVRDLTSKIENVPDSVKDLIQQHAEKQAKFIQEQRRGVMPLEASIALARSQGIDVPRLALLRPGAAMNAEQFASVHGAFTEKFIELNKLRTDIREAGQAATPTQKLKLAFTTYEANTLQRILMGVRTEWGRTGRIMQEVYKTMVSPSGRVKDTYARALAAIGGMKNVDQLIERLNAIDIDPTLTPIMRERKTVQFIAQTHHALFNEKMREFFVNSILSNPATHASYMLGEAALTEAEVLASFPAAAYDTVRAFAGAKTGWWSGQRERTFTGAAMAAVGAHKTAVQEVANLVGGTAMTAFELGRQRSMDKAIAATVARIGAENKASRETLLYFLTGVRSDDIAQFAETGRVHGRALEGAPGAILNIPVRAIDTYTTFFHAVGRNRELYQDAANAAIAAGHKPTTREFWDVYHDLISDPDIDMSERARQAGREASLRQHGGQLSDAFRAFRDVHFGYHPQLGPLAPVVEDFRPFFFVEPFTNITFAIASKGLEFSPLGFTRMATTRGGEQADAFGRAAVGSAIVAIFWNKALAGEMTGPLPDDPNEQQDFLRAGKKPYSVRVGDQWRSYDRFEPLATPLRTIVGLQRAAKLIGSEPFGPELMMRVGMSAAHALARSAADINFAIGLHSAINLFDAPNEQSFDARLTREAGRIASGFEYPAGLYHFLQQQTDPVQHDAHGFVEQIEASLPGMSELVRPKITGFGDVVRRDRQDADPLDAELAKHHLEGVMDPQSRDTEGKKIIAAAVQPTIGQYRLNDDEAYQLRQVSGRAVRGNLTALFGSKDYAAMDEPHKVIAIKKAIADGHQTGRAVTASAILLGSTDPGQISRAMAMGLSTITKESNRALFIEGQNGHVALTKETRDYLNAHRRRNADPAKDEPTVEDYLKIAPLIRQYESIAPFTTGNRAEWSLLDEARKRYRAIRAKDTTGDPDLVLGRLRQEDPRLAALYEKYDDPSLVNEARVEFLTAHPELRKPRNWIANTGYVQEGP